MVALGITIGFCFAGLLLTIGLTCWIGVELENEPLGWLMAFLCGIFVVAAAAGCVAMSYASTLEEANQANQANQTTLANQCTLTTSTITTTTPTPKH